MHGVFFFISLFFYETINEHYFKKKMSYFKIKLELLKGKKLNFEHILNI